MPMTDWTAKMRLMPADCAEQMRNALTACGGNVRKAAKLLGIDPRSWYHYVERLEPLGLADGLESSHGCRQHPASSAKTATHLRKSRAP